MRSTNSSQNLGNYVIVTGKEEMRVVHRITTVYVVERLTAFETRGVRVC